MKNLLKLIILFSLLINNSLYCAHSGKGGAQAGSGAPGGPRFENPAEQVRKKFGQISEKILNTLPKSPRTDDILQYLTVKTQLIAALINNLFTALNDSALNVNVNERQFEIVSKALDNLDGSADVFTRM